MKTKMKKLISIKSVPVFALVLLAGVTLITITGIVWAKSTEDAVDCEFTYGATAWPPEREWTDEEGIVHYRGIAFKLTSKPGSGNMEIEIIGTCNHNRDPVTGDGDFFGDDDLVEVSWGGLTGTFRGRHSGIAIDWVGYSTRVYQGISGDFMGWKLRLDGVSYFKSGPPKEGFFEGFIHNPHGE